MSNITDDIIEKGRPAATAKPSTYSSNFEEKEADHISIESETNERVLKQPPDGGRAWLVLFGCFCVSCDIACNYIKNRALTKLRNCIIQGLFCT